MGKFDGHGQCEHVSTGGVRCRNAAGPLCGLHEEHDAREEADALRQELAGVTERFGHHREMTAGQSGRVRELLALWQGAKSGLEFAAAERDAYREELYARNEGLMRARAQAAVLRRQVRDLTKGSVIRVAEELGLVLGPEYGPGEGGER